MRKLMLGFLFCSSFNALAFTKGELDKKILSCTNKNTVKVFRELMEDDLGIKPNSRTLVLLKNSQEKQDGELVFDDSPLLRRHYFNLSVQGSLIGRFRFRIGRPFIHSLNYVIKSKDVDGHVKTDIEARYTPRLNPQDAVDLKAEFLPSVIYTFSNLIRDNFGRISEDSTIKTMKVLKHPIFHQDVQAFKEVSSGEATEFSFASHSFVECMNGVQL
jgi:hypothetical protein